MPRAPRLEIPGYAYHVYANAVDGCKAFRDDDDRDTFLFLLVNIASECKWSVLEYSVLSTHYHLLLMLEKGTLSRGMQRLNGRFARYYNRGSKRIGALWRARYDSKLVETDSYLRELVRYVARNAIRAGICERPEDYAWCSYGAAIKSELFDPIVDEERLLGLFGNDEARARRALRAFVDEPDPRKRRCQIRVGDGSGTLPGSKRH
jgi:REP element-mobilizing transposase RayT